MLVRQISPKIASWLKDVHKTLADLEANGFKPTVISARDGLASLTAKFVTNIPTVAWVNDELVNGHEYNVPVRIYHPAPDEARPVLIYYHGGGHSAGSAAVYDPICRKLANATGHIVVSAEYRLAPENPYPAGLIDAYTVAKKVWEALDCRKLNYKKVLSVAGDSAGGALASSVSHRAQFDYSLDIANQILIYPCLDYTMNHPSIEENGENCFLTKGRIAYYFDNYFQKGECRLSASPLHGQFTSKLPRTLMVSVEFDPLRDEAKQYLAKLKQAGIEHQHLFYDDLIHAFLNMEDMLKDECEKFYQTAATFLNSPVSK